MSHPETTAPRRSGWGSDLVWALILVELGLVLGLVLNWPLVRLGFQGGLDGAVKKWEAAQAAQRFAGIPTLSLPQTYEIFEKQEALFIDARPPGEFRELHIAGALNLPAEDSDQGLPAFLSGLDKQKRIVVYCGTADCHAALKVAEMLHAQGFVNTHAFVGGFKVWDEAGYPVDTAQ